MMCLTPLTPATASSTRFVTWFCSSDGAAPGCVTVIETIGMSMFGKRVIGSCRKLKTPRTSSTMNRTIDGIGFRIAQAETLRRISASPPSSPARFGVAAATAAAPRRRRAGSCRRGRPRLAGLDALRDLDEAASAERPVATGAPRPCRPTTASTVAPVGAVEHRGGGHGDAGAARDLDGAAGEGADAQRRVLRQRDAHLAEPRRAVDLREDVADAPVDDARRRRPSTLAGGAFAEARRSGSR